MVIKIIVNLSIYPRVPKQLKKRKNSQSLNDTSQEQLQSKTAKITPPMTPEYTAFSNKDSTSPSISTPASVSISTDQVVTSYIQQSNRVLLTNVNSSTSSNVIYTAVPTSMLAQESR